VRRKVDASNAWKKDIHKDYFDKKTTSPMNIPLPKAVDPKLPKPLSQDLFSLQFEFDSTKSKPHSSPSPEDDNEPIDLKPKNEQRKLDSKRTHNWIHRRNNSQSSKAKT